MSAQGITDVVVKAIEQGDFDVIVMNFANADMVGHSGKMEPTVQAVEAVDAGLAEIYAALRRSGGSWIITADHGNAETMIDPVTKGPHTYHTTNPVPFILVDETRSRLRAGRRAAGYLADRAGIPGRNTAQGNDRPRSAFLSHARASITPFMNRNS